MADRHISIPRTFTEGDIVEWLKRFDICSKANGWNDQTKASKLPTLLEGEALATWLELSDEEQRDYKTAKERIVEQMVPMGFVTLEQFHHRKLRPGEALPLFLHELKKLLDQAMPNIDAETREQLLLHQFLAGLPTAVSRQLRAAGQTKNLEKVVERARLLMVLEEQGQVSAVASEDDSQLKQLREQISVLSEQVAALTTTHEVSRRQRVASLRCFQCSQPGHLQRNCPRRPPARNDRRCFACGLPGHMARDCGLPGNGQGVPVQGSRRPSRQ